MWRTKLQQSTCIIPGRLTPTSTSGIADDRLRVAADRFFDFRRKLKQLDSLLRTHLKDQKRASASRALVVKALGNVSRGSPLSELVGSGGDGREQPSSYAAVEYARQTSNLLERYEQEIVSYVEEWERTVSTRVATELKHIQTLHKTWGRYRQKVETLKTSAQRKKQTVQALEDKIVWNESKLRTAKKEYRRNLVAVTLLTEEVTDRGWKDLVPLMVRMIDFDIDATKSASDLLSGLSRVREEMVELSRRYEMDFEALHTGRLQILREEDAMDFVDPGDLQDLESTIASIEGMKGASGPLSNKVLTPANRNSATPPTSSDSDSPRPNDHKEWKEGQKDPYTDHIEAKEEEKEEQDEDSSTVRNYPTSIYLHVSQEGGAHHIDDETTLTGAPDLVSV